MTLGNHQMTNKDPEKDMVSKMHIHSADKCIILETKVNK